MRPPDTQCGDGTTPLVPPHWNSPAQGAPIVGVCIIGGPFYTATLYPEVYRGNWFIMDYSQGWIMRMVFDGAGNLTSTVPFATGLSGPVHMELGPDGMLYYVSILTGEVKRIRYNGPSAVATATPSSGYSPLSVNFSSAGSSDPNASPLTYLWDFRDGQTSTAANPIHAYASTTVQTFAATLTVTNNTSQRASATVKVTVGSLPPTATIQAPLNGTNVTPGQIITYQGSAIDPEDGAIRRRASVGSFSCTITTTPIRNCSPSGQRDQSPFKIMASSAPTPMRFD